MRAAPVITAPTGTLSNQRPTVTWAPVPGAVRYEIQLDNVTDNIRPVAKVGNLLTTSWTPTSDLPLAEYEVWVRAYNSANEVSVWSVGQRFHIAPTPVVITPMGRLPDNTPTISWEQMQAADTYQLIIRERFGAQNEVLNLTGLTTTTYTVTTPLPLGRYSYRVIAQNNPHNAMLFSPAISSVALNEFVVTEPPVITAPLSTVFTSHPVVAWTLPPGAGNSEIWIQQIDGIYEFHHVSNIAGTSYTVPVELGIGNYRVWVRTESATTPAEPSNWSLSKVFRVATPPPVIGPVGRVADATPTLTWQGVPGAATYEIWIDNNTAPAGQVVRVAGLTSLNYTLGSNLPIGSYTFWVRATNVFGVSSNWSNATSFEVVEPPALSGPASSTFSTQPTFSWTNLAATLPRKVGNTTVQVPTGASSYDLEIRDAISGAIVYTANGLTSITHTITTPLIVSTYDARVRAHAVSNGSAAATTTDWSAPLRFFVGGRPNVNSLGSTTNTLPTISWGTVDGASGYELYLSTDANPNVPLVNVNNIGSNSYTLTTALAKGTYRVWVRAINASTGATSIWSRVMIFQVVDNASSSLELTTPVLAVLPSNVEDFAFDSVSVSMLNAVEFGTVPSANAVPAFAAEKTSDSTATDTNEQTVPSASVLNVKEQLGTVESDQVLSDWDSEAWWDDAAGAPEVVAEPATESSSASAGLLGALLALTPKALRRRKRQQ
ncbi:MAG: hypothetical protein KDA85_07125 [Planctomycetaceae bacterium]|nr:hypothetical protein [Planctomycetaceae bacterium]